MCVINSADIILVCSLCDRPISLTSSKDRYSYLYMPHPYVLWGAVVIKKNNSISGPPSGLGPVLPTFAWFRYCV